MAFDWAYCQLVAPADPAASLLHRIIRRAVPAVRRPVLAMAGLQRAGRSALPPLLPTGSRLGWQMSCGRRLCERKPDPAPLVCAPCRPTYSAGGPVRCDAGWTLCSS